MHLTSDASSHGARQSGHTWSGLGLGFGFGFGLVVARAAQGAHLVDALDAAAREARGVGRQRGRERASMAAHEAAGRAVALVDKEERGAALLR